MTRSSCQLDRGDFAVSPLAAVLIEALRERATGVLEIETGSGASRIFFRGGHPAACQVFFGFRPLGQLLLELGWIDIEGLERSLSGVAAGKRQGEMLVELGLLSPEQLRLGLKIHQQAQLRTLAALDEGTYHFVPGTDLPAWTQDLELTAHRAIVEALTAGPGQHVAKRILSCVPVGHGLVLIEGWERSAAQFDLDAWETRFAGRLVQPQALDRVMAVATVPPERARAIAACFLLMGLARTVPLSAVPGTSPADGAVEGTSPSPESAEEEKRGRERELAEFEEARKAAEEEIRRLRAEQDEADRKAREDALSRPPPEFKSDAEEARARRAKLLRRAFDSVPGVPEELRSAPTAMPSPSRQGSGAPPRAAPDPAAVIKVLDGVASALETRIRVRHARIAEEDHFRRLGISRSASREAVKSAFFDAAKRYHPDALPPELSHLSREMRDIFTAIHEAYEVLRDEGRRHAYEESLDKR